MALHLDSQAPSGQDDPDPANSCEDPPERAGSKRVGPEVVSSECVRTDGPLSVEIVLAADVHERVDGSALAWILEHVKLIGKELRLRGELRIRIVGDAEMTATHQAYLGDPLTTDVMTFDLRDCAATDDRVLDVDVHACVDEAARRASELGHNTEREVLLYVLHGVLHCLGHDDGDEASYSHMHALEDQVLERIGVGATFATRRDETERTR